MEFFFRISTLWRFANARVVKAVDAECLGFRRPTSTQKKSSLFLLILPKKVLVFCLVQDINQSFDHLSSGKECKRLVCRETRLSWSQCGNLQNFLPDRFYVKLQLFSEFRPPMSTILTIFDALTSCNFLMTENWFPVKYDKKKQFWNFHWFWCRLWVNVQLRPLFTLQSPKFKQSFYNF